MEGNKLDTVISMPSGVFKPYAGVSIPVLIFMKTGSDGTDNVWFYGMHADVYSLDDKRAERRGNKPRIKKKTNRKILPRSFFRNKRKRLGFIR